MHEHVTTDEYINITKNKEVPTNQFYQKISYRINNIYPPIQLELHIQLKFGTSKPHKHPELI